MNVTRRLPVTLVVEGNRRKQVTHKEHGLAFIETKL